MSLQSLQLSFINGLLSSEDREIVDQISDHKRRSAQEQFSTYQGSVSGALTNALADIYPRVKQALGARFFNALAREYVHRYPSRSASLDNYGEQFAAFCHDFHALHDYPYIADICRVDWAWHRAFHTRDVCPAMPDALQKYVSEPEKIALVFHPTVTLIESEYPLHDIWMLNEEARASEPDYEVSLDAPSQCVLVWRPKLQVQTVALSSEQKQFLQQIDQADSLASAFEQMLLVKPSLLEAPQHLSEWLAFYLEQGVFCAPNLP